MTKSGGRHRIPAGVAEYMKKCAREILDAPNLYRAMEAVTKRENSHKSTVRGWIKRYFPNEWETRKGTPRGKSVAHVGTKRGLIFSPSKIADLEKQMVELNAKMDAILSWIRS